MRPLPDLSGLEVLVVEDHDDSAEMLTFMLAQQGASVRRAASAREAVDAVTASAPDVVVSDLAMPGEDGFWLLREVRTRTPERRRELPVVALTGEGRYQREPALAAGFNAYLTKPVEAEKLLPVVAELAAAEHAKRTA